MFLLLAVVMIAIGLSAAAPAMADPAIPTIMVTITVGISRLVRITRAPNTAVPLFPSPPP